MATFQHTEKHTSAKESSNSVNQAGMETVQLVPKEHQFETENLSLIHKDATKEPSLKTKNQQPLLKKYKGKEINKSGKIGSDAANYQDAISSGMNIRSIPLPKSELVIGKVRFGTSVYIKALNKTNDWFYIVSQTGTVGWINKKFIVADMPEIKASLHHITESNLLTIVKKHYVKSGKWNLSTGNDYTTIVTAIAIANQGRKGVTFNIEKYNSYKENNKAKMAFDPVAENFAIFHATEILSGHNIWLPSVEYVKNLQARGLVATRPELMSKAIKVGQGMTGFTAGVFEGFFGAILDALVGIKDIGIGVIKTLGNVITGEAFTKIEEIYEEFKKLTWQKVKQIGKSLLSVVVKGINKFKHNWSHSDMYKRWNFRGNIVGNILLEVVLAVFTGGIGNAIKWIGKLGKIAPRLAKIFKKIMSKVGDLIPPKFKGNKKRITSSLEDEIDVAFGKLERGEIKQKGALIGLQPHRHSTKVRKHHKVTGKDFESAHIAPGSALRDLPNHRYKEAFTILLPPKVHKQFDAHWKKIFRAMAKEDKKKISTQELFDVVSDAINKCDLSEGEKYSLIARLQDELFLELALKPGDLVRVPYSK